jgi:hypothetical protein
VEGPAFFMDCLAAWPTGLSRLRPRLLLGRRLFWRRSEPSEKPAPSWRRLLRIGSLSRLPFGPSLRDLLQHAAHEVDHGVGRRILTDLWWQLRLQLLEGRGRAIPFVGCRLFCLPVIG